MNNNNLSDRPKYNWKLFFLFVGLYAFGLLASYPALVSQAEIFIGILGDNISSTPTEFALVALINPLLLGIVLIYFGVRYFPRVDLHSLMAEKVDGALTAGTRKKYTLKESLPYVLLVSLIIAVLFLGFDVVFQNVLPENYQPNFSVPNVAQVISQIFYSGLAQEILLRFGVMSSLVYVLSGRGARLNQTTYIVSIIFTALLYAFAQYNSVVTTIDMSFIVLLRILLLDGLAGILYGFIYYKFHIEGSILSHMLTNAWVLLGHVIIVSWAG